MLHIQDAIVGHIEPTESELSIIDDSHFQRLRHISQFGFASLVYPGANHTRFEHSLGTMQITREIATRLKQGNEELECAGLLHDIGHGPFSHNSDWLLKKYLKMSHEQVGEEIISKTALRDVIQKSTLSMKKLLDYFRGNDLGQIITGSLGSDRIDYLIRDSHYTGIGYGLIDYQNIRDRFVWYKGMPAVSGQATASAESLLLARYSMFTTVYNHHAAMIAEGMYEIAAESAIKAGMDPDGLKTLNDWQMLDRMLHIKESRAMTQRLLERRLFKRVYAGYMQYEPDAKAIKDALESKGLREGEYIIKVRKVRIDGEDFRVVDNDNKLIGRLSDLSPLIKTLATTVSKTNKLVVACDGKRVESVKAAVEKALKL